MNGVVGGDVALVHTTERQPEFVPLAKSQRQNEKKKKERANRRDTRPKVRPPETKSHRGMCAS